MKLFADYPAESSAPSARWTADLPGERERLVRLCARLTGGGGNRDLAEDLAQETLFEAWRLAPRLRDETAWRAFVNGIARNLCLRRLRREGREASHLAPTGGGAGTPDGLLPFAWETESIADPLDIEAGLETEERAQLLDRALASLPESARTLLVERYVEEAPAPEIAARHGVSENALGVRLHRARAAFRRVVAADPSLAREAAAYGLLTAPPPPLPDGSVSLEDDLTGAHSDGWRESRIWCPGCAAKRLLVRFRPSSAVDAISGGGGDSSSFCEPIFAVRCPDCRERLGPDYSSAHFSLDAARVFGGVKGDKPALNRLNAWWCTYLQDALTRRVACCPYCGEAADMTPKPVHPEHGIKTGTPGLFMRCRRCRRGIAFSATGIVIHLPETASFYRRHPRVAMGRQRQTVLEGHRAVHVEMESRTTAARMDVFLDAENLALLSIRESG